MTVDLIPDDHCPTQIFMSSRQPCGIIGEELMVRLSPPDADRAVSESGVRRMDFTGRPMKGFLYVSPEVISTDAELASWVDEAADNASSMPPK